MKRRMYFFLKRLFDIVASLLALAVSSPLWILAILGILISDPGPIFFRAVRIGKDNREFRMWKFRSMRVPRKESEKSEKSFKADTNRVFAWGAVMRRLKIDELPQLLNILGGSMTVVGPRPAARDQADAMRTGIGAIAATVRPGLTGPAALYDYIYGDTVEDDEEYKTLVLPTRLALEAYYPTHMSTWYDIKIILWTAWCIFSTMLGKTPKRILNTLTACVSVAPTNEPTEAPLAIGEEG